ncbi:pentatricopeptide repeat-containing-like protein [Cinnamomum micranthum f. kanehirae]|uniref:Pentatricopeptide repeat-containing-like protein n=1 Tax=Cinnamomum micranthum f. kanehirae TaxID=337451 RepID=A0A3S3MPU9_9MAGN|nr:pentatricopeptide repeat-containing-like protein [Cinnamomum micranthum f. kanehirae]
MILPTRRTPSLSSSSKPSLSSLIDQCKSLKHLQQIHSHIITTSSTSFLTRILFFCATSSDPPCHLPYANAIFRTIPNPNLFAYNAMVRAHASQPHPSGEALVLFERMLATGIRPNHLTFSFLLKSCARLLDPDATQIVHSCVLKSGHTNDLFIQNGFIHSYANCGLLGRARQVFDEMRQRDVVSWNSILGGYLRSGVLDAALGLFRVMEERNVITWNSIITGFVQGGRAKEALGLFHEMQVLGDGFVEPDKVTFASVIAACASLGALDQGKWVHHYLKQHRLEVDMVIGTALVDMYGKCGCVETAVKVFDEMHKKDVLAWTAMISTYAIHGFGEEALRLLKDMEMQGVKPNHVTFVGLLCACAHAGLVDEGRRLFDSMRLVYLVEPQSQHYACMVDLLGRAGLFEEAERLISTMPMEPDVFVWGALLGACRTHRNVKLGERVAKYLIELKPENHAFYVMLLDIYAEAHIDMRM